MKPYIPDILGYKPFFIQTAEDSSALDTAKEWGLIAKTNPFPALPTAKSPFSVDFKDEHGVEEYTQKIWYDSFDYEMKFYIKTVPYNGITPIELLNSQLHSFFEKIRDGEFKIYDSYTGLGWQSVRYDSFSEESVKITDDFARAIFSIKFKVNDPVSAMYMADGVITENGWIKLDTNFVTGEVTAISTSKDIGIEGGSIDANTGLITVVINR